MTRIADCGKENQQAPASILVVEDDPDAKELLADLLRRRGYHVISRSNGADALDYLRRGGAPDLILLDLHMPVMDGYELRELLAREPLLSRAPIVVMTDARSVDRQRLGGIRVVPKPLRVHDLVSVIEAELLGRHVPWIEPEHGSKQDHDAT